LQTLLYHIHGVEKKFELLSSFDANQNSVLLCAFTGALPYQAFAPLVEYIRANHNLDSFNFTAFALQANLFGTTIFHCMTYKVAGFCADLFGVEILQQAFIMVDQLGYAPLHHVCESNTAHKLADVRFICNLLRKHDSAALTKAFAQSKIGYNPIHLLGLSATLIDIAIVEYLRKEFPVLFKWQLKQTDHHGNLPTHYAIRSGNKPLLQSLLADCTLAEQIELLLSSNKMAATGIDSAVHFSDEAMLEFVIGLIGIDQFYQYCNTHPMLAMQAEENPQLSEKFAGIMHHHLVLFDCTAYFVRLQTYYPTDSIYLQRLNDFRACLEHISKQETRLPPTRPDLQFDSRWLFFNTTNEYFELRKHIKPAMQRQLLACKAYFEQHYPDGIAKEIITSLFGVYVAHHCATSLLWP
jgi:hypothetical protein